jgi:hypothetical protein
MILGKLGDFKTSKYKLSTIKVNKLMNLVETLTLVTWNKLNETFFSKNIVNWMTKSTFWIFGMKAILGLVRRIVAWESTQ